MNKQILVSALGAMLLASCADHFDQNFETVRPDKEAQYGYLEQYDALKEYIKDRPNFHLGIGTAVDEYNKKELVYALTNSNFNETVAGNAMKMASCVADDGSMNFEKVSEYVKNATDAGLSVYGHTLAWHAQQPNKYLNGLIADKELPPSSNVTRCLVIKNAAAGGHYDAQLYFPAQLSKGKKYVFKMNAKATAPFDLILWAAPGDADLGSISVGTQWNEYKAEFTPSDNYKNFVFAAGKLGGELDIKSLSLCEEGSNNNLIVNGDIKGDEVPCTKPYSWHTVTTGIQEVAESQVVEIFTDCLRNGEMKTGDDMSNFVVREAGKGDVAGTPIAGGPDGKNCVVVHANANAVNEWDTQFFIYTPNKTWSAGDNYKITFYYKASENIDVDIQCHGEPGNYKHWQFLSTNPTFTTQWQKYEANGTIPKEGDGMKAIAFNLNKGKKDHAIDYYFADIHWGTVEMGNKKPLTDEEKKEKLTPALQNWIYGMMEATEGKVKAWDVVNEAISGEDKDGDGYYDLWSVTHGTVDPASDDAKNNFYWQDYLGDIDYVRTAVAAARKGFVDAGGKREELKLFINDYNLEAAWDKDHKKLKSLIHWIEEWEKDGKTKIDGIGSQMHVTCSMDPATQKKNEEAYVNMLNLMVDSHKLVRISELDMGLADKDGNLVNTTDMTEEQHKAMRAYYEFIVKKYLEIVPENQQWGICQWCATDSPANSGWRAGLPVGLWDLDYYRKHTYGGFAAGLGASEYWNNAK